MPTRPTAPPAASSAEPTPGPPRAGTTTSVAAANAGPLVRWQRLASGLQARHRFAALGVVGALMCALPLLQVLRFQGDALSATRAVQAALDPLANAVALQRGLVQHRDVAGAVLRGVSSREGERRQRQRVVNERLTELELSLRARDQARATQEGEALRGDWTELSRRVEERSVAASDSDAAHRLLVEQTLQVIDYVSLAMLDLGPGLDRTAGPDASAWVQAVLHTLPRESARLGLLASAAAGSAEAHPREFAATQRRLQQVIGDLQTAAQAVRRDSATASAAQTPLIETLATLSQRADSYFSLQRSSAPPDQLLAAASALTEAESALYTHAHSQLAAALAAHAEALRQQRLTLLAMLAALAVAGTLLGLSLLPPTPPGQGRRAARPALRRFNAADPAPDSRLDDEQLHAAPSKRGEAQRLMQRLRDPGALPRRPHHDTSSPHTQPPEE